MRVIHVINSIDPRYGGPSRTVPALVDELTRQGIDARLVVTVRDGLLKEVDGADLIHDHGLWLRSNHAAARSAHRARVPRVVSPRGMMTQWAFAHRPWKKRLAWALYQRRDLERAAAIHVTSQDEAEDVRRTGIGVDVKVLPNAVSRPHVLPHRRRGPRRRVLFLSRLHPVKGVALLVEAWSRVRPWNWELMIAGPDESGHRAVIEHLAHQFNVTDTVRFVGPVKDGEKWLLYRSAELFILPTRSENFGLVVAEALSAGLPVITTVGAPWRVLQTQQCGWWVDVRVEAIAGAIEEATACSPAELEAMGARGQEYVARVLSWPHIAREMIALYEHTVSATDLPRS